MIIDNKDDYSVRQNIKTVWDCILAYTDPNTSREGQMDIVTGFFSVAALNLLYQELSDKNSYRIVLGDIRDMTRDEDFLKRAVDLLQGDSSLESAFQLSNYAKNAVLFLKQQTVEVRTINNAFCHAKSYVYTDNNDAAHDYGIVGSSNLTEAGLGRKASSNVELNIVETGRNNATVKELKEWFESLWKTVASTTITIPLENGRETKIDAKSYLIQQIEQIFKAYTPEQIYQKILFELFRADIEMNDSIEYRRDMEFLQKSKIWNTLFDFQQSGVVSLVKLLTRYGGAILADAVGLGKTFSALGVIKYFQNNGYHTLILCPKKLRNNWVKYQYNAGSRFEEDHFEYVVRSHTDLQKERLSNYSDNITKNNIQSYEKLLIVVDESHNLRNDKSSRYKMLLNDIINESAKRGHSVKVLLLSATPINTGLIDIRNQFKLIGYDENKHFYDEFKLPVPTKETDPLRAIFQQANNKYTEWSFEPHHTVNSLRSKLHGVNNFFKLTDELIIARNRAFVTTHNGSLRFPTQLKPRNEHVGIQHIGAYKDINDMYDDMKILRLTAYQPTQYNYELYQEYIDKAAFILDMVQNNVLYQKALPSLLNNDEEALFRALMNVKNETKSDELHKLIVQNWVVKQSIKKSNAGKINWDDSALRELSLAGMMISLFIKRLESSWNSCLSTLTKVRALHEKWLGLALQRTGDELDDEDVFKDEEDIETLGKRRIDFNKMLRIDDYVKDLERDITILNRLIENLTLYENQITSGKRRDDKLETLINILKAKQDNPNQKAVIFTSYADTAQYIFDHVSGLFPNRVALVTGDINSKDLESILKRFAPYSKVLLETKDNDAYQQLLLQPIDILVATDCVSEGQNLQDADMVINYDIHWNPVRLIQRFGRIDRIGSPNANIQSVNFWPSTDIESYLGLSERVSNRMVAMNVAGSETLQANDTIAQMEQNNEFRMEQDKRSLRSIHDDKVGQIEDMGTPTFDALSLSEFKADAEEYAQRHLKELQQMPNGAFSGFRWALDQYAQFPECLVALLRHRKDSKSFHLLCIPVDENAHADFKPLDKAEVLQLLSEHKNESAYLPHDILSADPATLQRLVHAITAWFAPKTTQTVVDSISNMLQGNTDAVVEGNPDETIEQRTDISKYDLIAWDYVSKTE